MFLWWVTRKRGQCHCHIDVPMSIVVWPSLVVEFLPVSLPPVIISDSMTRSQTLVLASTSSLSASPLSWQQLQKTKRSCGVFRCLHRGLIWASSTKRDTLTENLHSGRAPREPFIRLWTHLRNTWREVHYIRHKHWLGLIRIWWLKDKDMWPITQEFIS